MRSVLVIIFIIPGSIYAQDSLKIIELEQRIKRLETQLSEQELDRLKRDAQSLPEKSTESLEDKIFRGGERALQALNPEISMAIDAMGQAVLNKDYFSEELRSGGDFRVAELQFQSTLDPFSTTKIILEFKPTEVEFAEAYMTWSNILGNISLTAGKFRQQFGVINRWHVHTLDQFDFPLALTSLLGNEGLNQIGISFDILLPSLIADAQEITFQLTNAQNDHLFAGKFYSFPAMLARFRNFFDLSADSYLEIGLSGMSGKNNRRGFDEDGTKILEEDQWTRLAGVDITFLWEPVRQAKYRSFLWRSELFYVDKKPDITAFGGYSYLEYKFARQWHAGFRFDYTQPFKADNNNKYLMQFIPYVTWWQSPWVRLRLQGNIIQTAELHDLDPVVRLQITWAIGPHKHERY
jgi:hypothetical protein